MTQMCAIASGGVLTRLRQNPVNESIAADLSEQIYCWQEPLVQGTWFSMNGSLTIGTLDGASQDPRGSGG